jgi:hypothetical protein
MFKFLKTIREDYQAAEIGQRIGEELVNTGIDNVGQETIGQVARDLGVNYDNPRLKRIVDAKAFDGWNNGLTD